MLWWRRIAGVNCARGRADGAIWAVAERRPMGKDSALAAQATAATARWSASGERPQGAGRDFVDSAQRRLLAGFTERVSFAFNLLATAAGLGRARDLAGDLASVSRRPQ